GNIRLAKYEPAFLHDHFRPEPATTYLRSCPRSMVGSRSKEMISMCRYVSLNPSSVAALGGLMLLILAGCEPGGDDSATSAPGLTAEKTGGLSIANTSVTASTRPASNAPPVDAMLRQAAEQGKYLFVFVWKQDDEPTRQMRQVFDAAIEASSARALPADVLVSAANQQVFVEEYGLARAPFPLVLAIAPNGAITGGFPSQFSKDDLLGAFASPATEASMKHLQAGKLVVLCVQNDASADRDSSLAAARAFQSDAQFADVSEIVMLDPANSAEASFLRDLQVPSTAAAVTVVLAPPGSPVAMFEGSVSKDQLADAVAKAQSACCPGGQCGPEGCKPQ
ncbi:MAG: hypothetical protein WEA31_11135, partial [Pirellulales bacterium]